MRDQYTKDYLKNVLLILKDQIEDLTVWSVYNGDTFLEEITKLTDQAKRVEHLITQFYTEGGEENE